MTYGATDIDEDHEARASGFVTGPSSSADRSNSNLQLMFSLYAPTTGPAIITDSSGDHIQHTQDAVINISGDLYDRAQRWRDLADYEDGNNFPSSPRIDPGGCPPHDPRVDKFAAAAYYIR
eukprot:12047-Heterococcus_DN1.PRE.2